MESQSTTLCKPAIAKLLEPVKTLSQLDQLMSEEVAAGLGAADYKIFLIPEPGTITHEPPVKNHGSGLPEWDQWLREYLYVKGSNARLDFESGLPCIVRIDNLPNKPGRMPHIDALQLKGIREILAIRIVKRNYPLALILLFGNSPGGFRSTVLSTLSFWTEGLTDVFGRIRKSTAKTIHPPPAPGLPGVIGGDPIMNDVIRKVRLVAPKQSTVLLTGETGTGKEVFAKAIHTLSERQNTEMVTVNCAALPEHLIESELFGHEKGSFTGAVNRRIGKFELAHNGTILLDEIGELPLQLQARLLRVLQEKKIERIGGNSTIHVNVRIIAATNRSLAREVAEGRFREDLYYRLNVYPVEIPPLRERLSDIPILWNHFLSLNAAKLQRAVPSSSPEVLRNLGSHDWPGNIRELQHLAERVLLTNTGNHISRVELPCRTRNEKDKGAMVIQPLCDMEREYISKVITHCGGRISGKKGAAALLGLPPTTLLSKMQKLGIRKRLNIIPAAAID